MLLSRSLGASGRPWCSSCWAASRASASPPSARSSRSCRPDGWEAGFGAFNAITGLAALPAAGLFGLAYQYLGGSKALIASGILTIVAVGWWLLVIGKEKTES